MESMISDDELEDDEFEEDEIEAKRDAEQMLAYAYYYLNLGDMEQAGELAIEAKDLFEELQLPLGNAEARLLLGFIKHERGEFKDALPLLASAQQQFAIIGKARQHCATLYLLALCHIGIERPGKAVYALKLAREASKTRKEDTPSPSEERSTFIPDWETLDKLVIELLDKLEGQS
jgi:hypothetical protein